ncbi:MAG TPA: hypothetical protein VGV61_06710 [Thermoanaerobaculia bacterium]|jgi:hypothetical protein|nr:hypothetical protein [Thermoanaerobaculia bacterium]
MSPPILSVDVSRWPLAILTYTGKPTNGELEAHLREVEEKVLGRHEPFVQIVDQRRGEMPDPVQRAMIADHQLRMEKEYAEYCLGEAYVVTPQIRGGMVAVFWRAAPPYPYAFVDTLAEAMAWVEERLPAIARPRATRT